MVDAVARLLLGNKNLTRLYLRFEGVSRFRERGTMGSCSVMLFHLQKRIITWQDVQIRDRVVLEYTFQGHTMPDDRMCPLKVYEKDLLKFLKTLYERKLATNASKNSMMSRLVC